MFSHKKEDKNRAKLCAFTTSIPKNEAPQHRHKQNL